MKPYILALILNFSAISLVQAQIYADVATTEGTFTIEIDYVNTPLTAANFLGLATGSKTWIDSTTGIAKSDTPYFDGITFYRVVSGFINQTGSQNGLGNDGPGYVFSDELDTSDFSQAYAVAMANRGPNTNGSSFFITVAAAPSLDNRHTIFGTVPADDGVGGIVDGSRAVIDTINAVTVVEEIPVTDITIQSITIRRIGAAAIAFVEATQNLPVVSGIKTAFSFSGPENDPLLLLTQPIGSTLNLGLSPDLTAWTTTDRYLESAATSPLANFDVAALQENSDKHFYTPTLVTWPNDAIFPASLADRTLTILTAADPTYPFIFEFDSTGETGTWNYTNPSNPLSGTMIVTENVTPYDPDGYGANLVMSLTGLNFSTWILRLGLDETTATELSGRSGGFGFSATGSLLLDGTYILTR